MGFDFKKIPSIKGDSSRDPDWANPVKFFYKLLHPSIKDLYPIQHDLLKRWHQNFIENKNDSLISLDTGVGKTLVGILIAESIRRTRNAKVIYVCPNNYLVAQTVEKAEQYGLRPSVYSESTWRDQDSFLENKTVCITNYDSVFNARSIFKSWNISGCVFDDAHLAIELLDKQYTLTVTENSVQQSMLNLFVNSTDIGEKVGLIRKGDPTVVAMVPFLEWCARLPSIKEIIQNSGTYSTNLSWINIREKLNRAVCFLSHSKVEITFLYPDVKGHQLMRNEVCRVYLSATLPFTADFVRTFDTVPNPIEVEHADYRPERLFIFSESLKFQDASKVVREQLHTLRDKALVLVPSRGDFSNYRGLPNVEFVESTSEAETKITSFRGASNQVLVLANRYDGIDMVGDACRFLVVDGFPFIGSLKLRFLASFFERDKNDFLRSYLASRLVQAFGRTVRGYDDYSVIIVLTKRLHDWLINRDNSRFFREDLLQDLEIGKAISRTVEDINSLRDLTSEMLSRADGWKSYIETERTKIVPKDRLTADEIKTELEVARIERKIYDLFLDGDFSRAIKEFSKNQTVLGSYSKSLVGLFLSISAVCYVELGDFPHAAKMTAEARGISPIFGSPPENGVSKSESARAKRIRDIKSLKAFAELSEGDPKFEENLKELGRYLGFKSSRPEKEPDRGTLDVLWEDEEQNVVIGLEAKVNKESRTLSKEQIDQALGHWAWLEREYPKRKKLLFVIGNFDSYNKLGSPSAKLYYASMQTLNDIVRKLHELYQFKNVFPSRIDSEIERLNLTNTGILPLTKIVDLKAIRQ